MTHVITGACIGLKDQSCVETCPVDCILGDDDDKMLFIDPALCIDCAACVPACPVTAIYLEADLPPEMTEFTAINEDYFSDRGAAIARVDAIAENMN